MSNVLDDELDNIGTKSSKKVAKPSGKPIRDKEDEIPVLCAYEKNGELVIDSPNEEWLEWWRGPNETCFTSRRAHVKAVAEKMPNFVVPITIFSQDSYDLAIHILYTFEQHIPGSARLSESLAIIGDDKKCETFPYTSLISADNRSEEDDKIREKEKKPRIPEGLGYSPSLEV